MACELARAGGLVSFNGKSFDAPLLETRYLYHRLVWAAGAVPHLDMLHVARRFWKREDAAGEPGCSLLTLERHQLGHRRQGDVAGFEVPARYFQFIRTGDARPLATVFEHNRLDLLSLAALTVRVCIWSAPARRACAIRAEALALGSIYAGAGLAERSSDAYERAVALWSASRSSSAILIDALRALAIARRRARRYADAAGYWRQLLDVSGCPRHLAREASEALAIHHEHRVRDLVTAGAFARRSLDHGTSARAERGGRIPAQADSAEAGAVRRGAPDVRRRPGRKASELTTASAGGRRLFLPSRGRLLAALGGLRAELLREPLDAAFRVDQLLTAGEERVAVRADFQVQFGLGRTRLPRRPARAARFDLEILRVDGFFHGALLASSGKTPL